MGKRGPKTAEAENREPRDVVVGVCLTRKESEVVDKVAKALGFRSRSGLIAYIVEPLADEGFTAASFVRLGNHFRRIVSDVPTSKIDPKQFNIFRKMNIPEIEDVNREQK